MARQYRKKNLGGKRKRRVARRPKAVTRSYNNNLMGSSVRPDRMLVKLPYHDTFQLNAAAGFGTSQVMNLNSIYDPDRSGTGHQPLGYDQWAGFYKKYRVFKVAYDITFSAVSNQPANPVEAGTVVGLIAQNGSGYTPPQVGDATFEQPHMRKGVVGTSMGNSTRSFKGVHTLPRIAGRPAVSYKSDDKYQANFGYNPNEFITLSIIAQSMAATSPVSITCSVRMVYFVELFDPYQLEISNTDEDQRHADPNVGTEKEVSGYKPTPLIP